MRHSPLGRAQGGVGLEYGSRHPDPGLKSVKITRIFGLFLLLAASDRVVIRSASVLWTAALQLSSLNSRDVFAFALIGRSDGRGETDTAAEAERGWEGKERPWADADGAGRAYVQSVALARYGLAFPDFLNK